MYSETENKVFCVLNAPNKEAVEKHHRKIGLKPDWIHESRQQSSRPIPKPAAFLYGSAGRATPSLFVWSEIV